MLWRKNKTLFVSLALLILVGVILGLEIYRPWTAVKGKTNYFGGQINKFCVNDVCLQKNGADWLVIKTGNYQSPAYGEVVADYAQKLENIQFGDVISTNPNNFADLGIGVNLVMISANGKSLEIGKINSNYDGTYVRENNGQTVYNIGVILEKNNLTNSDQWVNKTVTNLAVLQTNKITISQNGKVRQFTPKNGSWDDPKWMEKADSLMAINYLNGFIPGNETQTVITIETDNQKATLILGDNLQNKITQVFWATIDQKNYYSISADDYHLLTGKIK